MAADESKEEYKIRCVKDVSEVENILIQWASNEGWGPGTFDGKPFYFADKQGFFVGELNGKVISCISCVKYNDNYSFLGFYIVDSAFRGKGYGMKIWKHSESRMK